MTRISCAQGRWRIDGHPFLVICGEIDYFRVHRNNWADRLGRLKANGANAVATYIPWLLHEPVEGRFDFTTYDLAAFIDACAAAGLWLIVRPGPYVYSELVCDGLPQWLWADYPALRAKRHDGSDHGRSAISYTHPDYLTHAARWYAAVLPLLVPRQAHHGGPIMAMQVDNELLGVCSDDRNETSFGIGRPTGRWPEVVARRGALGAANAAYGTAADSFALIRPPERAGSSDRDRRLSRDWQSGTLAAVADYVSTPVWNSAPPSMPTAGSPGPLLVWRSTRDGALLTFAPRPGRLAAMAGHLHWSRCHPDRHERDSAPPSARPPPNPERARP